jgi:hypothetical protein
VVPSGSSTHFCLAIRSFVRCVHWTGEEAEGENRGRAGRLDGCQPCTLSTFICYGAWNGIKGKFCSAMDDLVADNAAKVARARVDMFAVVIPRM